MYVPTQFKEDSVPVLHDAIRAARLGSLVTFGPEGLIASHLPMLLDAEPGPYGTLYGHVSKGNPQWKAIDTNVQALAMFSGPDAYVTPSWYATKQQTGKVVPTWNYVAVHVYGTIEFFHDADRLLDVVTRLTSLHEGKRAAPWAVEDAPADFVAAQLKGIVGFRLPIVRLDGKWKMSQNRSAEDRGGVIAGLEGSDDVADRATAAAMVP